MKQALKDDLRARSAYKLMEIQNKYKLIQSNSFVIDLGAAPGGWSMVSFTAMVIELVLVVVVYDSKW